MNTDGQSIAATARFEADRMRAAVVDKAAESVVHMSVSQFRHLALLIERLADDLVADAGAEECWLDDQRRTASPSFRSWVPLRHFVAGRELIETNEAELADLRMRLAAREADYVRLTALAFGLQPTAGTRPSRQ